VILRLLIRKLLIIFLRHIFIFLVVLDTYRGGHLQRLVASGAVDFDKIIWAIEGVGSFPIVKKKQFFERVLGNHSEPCRNHNHPHRISRFLKSVLLLIF
jgi:hypothetical protein